MGHIRITVRMHALASEIRVRIIDIFTDIFTCRTIITVGKILDYRFNILVRIPHKFGYKIGTQFLKFACLGLIIALLEHTHCIMVAESLDLRLKKLEIRHRKTIVREIRSIIPDIKILRNR